MDKETKFILNDLIDIVDALSDIVRELNPGADFGFIDFVAERVNRTMMQIDGATVPNGERA